MEQPTHKIFDMGRRFLYTTTSITTLPLRTFEGDGHVKPLMMAHYPLYYGALHIIDVNWGLLFFIGHIFLLHIGRRYSSMFFIIKELINFLLYVPFLFYFWDLVA